MVISGIVSRLSFLSRFRLDYHQIFRKSGRTPGAKARVFVRPAHSVSVYHLTTACTSPPQEFRGMAGPMRSIRQCSRCYAESVGCACNVSAKVTEPYADGRWTMRGRL